MNHQEQFAPFHENLACVTSREAGGKGVNISRALTENGVENLAVIITGKENQDSFLKDLENEGLKERFMKIIQLFYSASALDKFAAHAELISLISAVSKLKDASGTASILGKAKRFIEGHYSENITVKSIAGHCNVSETHLFRVFKNSLSTSPNDYISEVRIAAAKKLLCITEMSVNEIAYSCGFNSLSYFSDCFKRKCNTSPSAFRKQYKYPS